MSFLLFQMKNLLDSILYRHRVRAPPRLLLQRRLRIVEHTRTEAHAPIVTTEDVVVAAPLTSLPEFVVLRQLGECYGLVAESCIQLHYGQ